MSDMLDTTIATPMVYVGETPWHLLGKRLTEESSFDEWMEPIDWRVALEPITRINVAGKTVQEKSQQLLYRMDTGNILGVVGPRFQLHQNVETMEFFKEFCEANACTMETVGSLKDGRVVWGLARMNREWSAGRLADGTLDKCGDYLLLTIEHRQARDLKIRYVMTRVVCWNTISAALRERTLEWRMSHTKKFNASARAEAQEVMGLSVAAAQEVAALMQSLAQTKISDRKLVDWVCKLVSATGDDAKAIIEGDQENMPRVARKILASYEAAPGATPGTAWGFVNAVTHFVDHVSTRKAERRALTGIEGQGMVLKQKAIELVTA